MDDTAPIESVTVALRNPITDEEGNPVASLTFRPANVADAIETSEIENPNAQSAALYARMCGLPIAVFRRVTLIDLARIKEQAGPLTGPGQDLAMLAGLLGLDPDEAIPPSGAQPSS